MIPVLLRPVLWDTAPFARLQALPTGGRPVTTWANRDEAFSNIAAGIRDAALRISDGPAPDEAAGSSEPVEDTAAERVLDAAIPKNVTVGQAAELLIQIRRTDSGGLRAIVAADPDTEAQPEDVRSNEFALEFPRGPDGRLAPLRVQVSVDAPDFQPPRSEKTIVVTPEEDTEVVTFLLTPVRAGRLIVCVNIGWQDAVRASRVIRTNAGAASAAVAGPGGITVVSMPLFTISGFTGARRPTAAPSGSRPPEAPGTPGEFTRIFGNPAAPAEPATAAAAGGPAPISRPPSAPSAPRRSRLPWGAAAAAVVVIGSAAGVWSVMNGPTATTTSAPPPRDERPTSARHKTPPTAPPRFTLDVLDTAPAGRGELRINIRYDLGDLKPTGPVFVDAQPLDSAGQGLHYVHTGLGDAAGRSGTATVTVRNAAPKEREPHAWNFCLVEKPPGSGDSWTPVRLGCRVLDRRIYLPPGVAESTRE